MVLARTKNIAKANYCFLNYTFLINLEKQQLAADHAWTWYE